MDVVSANWRILLVFLVIVVVALKALLGLDDATVDKLLWFVSGGATALATEGVVRTTVKKNAENAATAELPISGPEEEKK